MTHRGMWFLTLAAFSGLLAAGAAQAWGGHGHRVVARLAQARLLPEAQAQVAWLLKGEAEPTLAGVADWADDLREAGEPLGRATERWHFVNLPKGHCTYVAARDCPDGQCVVAAIDRQFDRLSDATRPRAERAEALKFLVHLVADAHQPLHAGHRDDRGGNTVQLRWQDKGTNLHAVWDRLLPAHRGLAPCEHAAYILAHAPTHAAIEGRQPAAAWVGESCALVESEGFYPGERTLPAAYLGEQLDVAEGRLRQAGERLADMLNRALAHPAATAAVETTTP